MSKKYRKILFGFAIIAIACGGLYLTIQLIADFQVKTNLEQLAYENIKLIERPIYIKEYISQSEYNYVPYIVVTDDYDGKVLLLRKSIIVGEEKPINEGDTLITHKYGKNASAYYKDSYMDKYLNTEYFSKYSDYVRKNIAETNIEITNDNSNKEIEVMSAKVFLLSLNEYNLGKEVMCLKEGKKLKYFESNSRRAITDDKNEMSYWTRTREILDDKINFAVSYKGGSRCMLAGEYTGVRPAFCMDGNTKIKLSKDVISGKKVYVLEGEQE